MTATEADEAIAEVTRRIVERFRPQRVILFGSRARGDHNPESDADILIVGPSDTPRGDRTVPVLHAIQGKKIPADVVWWTPEEIEEWRDVRSHFINRALRDGKVLYEGSA